MIRAICIAITRRAYLRAAAAHDAYQRQPADGAWAMPVAYALSLKRDRLAVRLAQLITH